MCFGMELYRRSHRVEVGFFGWQIVVHQSMYELNGLVYEVIISELASG